MNPLAAIGRAFLALLEAIGRLVLFALSAVTHIVRPPFYPRVLLRQMVDIQLQDLNTSWAIRPDIQLVYSTQLQDFVPWNTIMHHSNFSHVWLKQ